jgi:hypothetical protein
MEVIPDDYSTVKSDRLLPASNYQATNLLSGSRGMRCCPGESAKI